MAGYSFGRGAVNMSARSLAERDAYARRTIDLLHPGRGASLSRPVSVHWSRIPYSVGISAHIAQSDAEAYDLMTGPEGPFIFAGEHLSHVGAWQEGAFVSAWRAVGQIAEQTHARTA